MAFYVSLVTFTDQGMRNIKKTTNRAEAYAKKVEKAGVKVHTTLWTLGNYDIIHIFEAPDADAAAAFGISLSAMGNVRTLTMRAFTADEMRGLRDKIMTPFSLLDDA